MPVEAETAIREYLTFITTGDLPDRPQIAQLEEAAANATDVIQRLLAQADLAKARPTPGALHDDFVAVAKTWAEKNDVPPAAFIEMGVSADVIQEVWPTRPDKAARPVRRRATYPRINRDEVTAKIVKLSGPFTVQEAAAAAGLGYPTATVIVKELAAQGRVEQVGWKPSPRGRQSQLWKAVKTKK
jgi:hypothetical protein